MADKGMVVVAAHRGYYGNTERKEGERFALSTVKHFSKKWMVDPKKDAERARQLELQYVGPRALNRDVSDSQLLSEIAESAGVVPALRAEIAQLKKRIKELEATDEKKEPEVEAAEVAGADESTAGEAGAGAAEEPDADPGAEDDEGQAANADKLLKRRR